jgi:hypothetical protein
VLTGDVVGSTQLSAEARARLHRVMRKTGALVWRALGRTVMPLSADIFGGDSWQLLLTQPGAALRAALLYRAVLVGTMNTKGLDTRVVIAVGTVDFVPRRKVSEGEGEAFRASGRLLAEKEGRSRRMRFAAPGAPDAAVWDLVVQWMDTAIVSSWTPSRALAVSGAVRGWTQERISSVWRPPISQPAVGKHLRGAEWPMISTTLDAFRDRWSAGQK